MQKSASEDVNGSLGPVLGRINLENYGENPGVKCWSPHQQLGSVFMNYFVNSPRTRTVRCRDSRHALAFSGFDGYWIEMSSLASLYLTQLHLSRLSVRE